MAQRCLSLNELNGHVNVLLNLKLTWTLFIFLSKVLECKPSSINRLFWTYLFWRFFLMKIFPQNEAESKMCWQNHLLYIWILWHTCKLLCSILSTAIFSPYIDMCLQLRMHLSVEWCKKLGKWSAQLSALNSNFYLDNVNAPPYSTY